MRRPGCRSLNTDTCEYPGSEVTCPEPRVCKVITGADTAAADIARAVFNKYIELTGATPHFVISHLHRSRLDPNRPIAEAAQGNEEAVSAYRAFHGGYSQNLDDGYISSLLLLLQVQLNKRINLWGANLGFI